MAYTSKNSIRRNPIKAIQKANENVTSFANQDITGGTITGAAISGGTIQSTTLSSCTINYGNMTFPVINGVVFSGPFYYDPPYVSTISAGGEISLSSSICEVSLTSTGEAYTLPNGSPGRSLVLTIICISELTGTNTGIITPVTKVGFNTITLNGIGSSVDLFYKDGQGWFIKSSFNATIA